MKYSIVVAAMLLGGCTSGASAVGLPASNGAVTQPASILSVGAPALQPAVRRCRTRSVYSKFGRHAWRIPPCKGWTGTLGYAEQEDRLHFRLMTSTTNAFGAPPPPSGTAVFYISVTYDPIGHGVSQFSGNAPQSFIASPRLSSQHAYTLNVYNLEGNQFCPSGSCVWTMNIGAPSGGRIDYPSPLSLGDIVSSTPAVWQFVQD
jgi:hypothetical protein